MKKINYSKTINYFVNKGHTVTEGIDHLCYAVEFEKEIEIELKELVQRHTQNTNVEYYSLLNYPEFEFINDYKMTHYYMIIDTHISTDEFTFKGFQIAFNNDTIKVTIYGTLRRYAEKTNMNINEFIISYLEKYKIKNITHILRIDYRFDIFDTTPHEVFKHIKKVNTIGNRKLITYGKGKDLETAYIGSKKNRFAFTRTYNKTLQIGREGKEKFYTDYPKKVTRLEFQFGYKFTGEYRLATILEKIYNYTGYSNVSQFKGKHYQEKRYDPDVIFCERKYLRKRINSTVKLAKNNIDIRNAVKEVNNEQDKYYIRVKKYTKTND